MRQDRNESGTLIEPAKTGDTEASYIGRKGGAINNKLVISTPTHGEIDESRSEVTTPRHSNSPSTIQGILKIQSANSTDEDSSIATPRTASTTKKKISSNTNLGLTSTSQSQKIVDSTLEATRSNDSSVNEIDDIIREANTNESSDMDNLVSVGHIEFGRTNEEVEKDYKSEGSSSTDNVLHGVREATKARTKTSTTTKPSARNIVNHDDPIAKIIADAQRSVMEDRETLSVSGVSTTSSTEEDTIAKILADARNAATGSSRTYNRQVDKMNISIKTTPASPRRYTREAPVTISSSTPKFSSAYSLNSQDDDSISVADSVSVADSISLADSVSVADSVTRHTKELLKEARLEVSRISATNTNNRMSIMETTIDEEGDDEDEDDENKSNKYHDEEDKDKEGKSSTTSTKEDDEVALISAVSSTKQSSTSSFKESATMNSASVSATDDDASRSIALKERVKDNDDTIESIAQRLKDKVAEDTDTITKDDDDMISSACDSSVLYRDEAIEKIAARLKQEAEAAEAEARIAIKNDKMDGNNEMVSKSFLGDNKDTLQKEREKYGSPIREIQFSNKDNDEEPTKQQQGTVKAAEEGKEEAKEPSLADTTEERYTSPVQEIEFTVKDEKHKDDISNLDGGTYYGPTVGIDGKDPSNLAGIEEDDEEEDEDDSGVSNDDDIADDMQEYMDDIDLDFVEKYDNAFNDFVANNPKFLVANPQLVHALRVTKLQSMLTYQNKREEELIVEKESLLMNKKEMEMSYQVLLKDASRKKAAHGIDLQTKLMQLQSNIKLMEGKLMWSLVKESEKRAKHMNRIKEQIKEQSKISKMNILKVNIIPTKDELLNDVLPKKADYQVIRDCAMNFTPTHKEVTTVSKRDDGSVFNEKDIVLSEKEQNDLRLCKLNNAFMTNEIKVLSKKLQYVKEEHKKKVGWIESVLIRMNDNHVQTLKDKYTTNLGFVDIE